MKVRQSDRETQYRPQAGKTLQSALRRFITREFPRLGGPWVVNLLVDRLLQIVAQYQVARENLQPGQVLWPAIALDESPGYRKPVYATRQVPVILTLANQEDVADLRQGVKWNEILRRALVRVLREAHSQGGVLTTADLSVLFHRSHSWVADMIRQYEQETGEVVPRRGNVHDMGRTVTHKRIICRKAYLEGKTTDVIARETSHSPEAVDHYLLDFARVYYALVLRGMSVEEVTFAIQRPRSLVEEYVKLIVEFGLHNQQLAERIQAQLEKSKDRIGIGQKAKLAENERREQAQPMKVDPLPSPLG
jgi:hypothetical protein